MLFLLYNDAMINIKIKLLKGYLLIRGLHSREEVLSARKGFAFLWEVENFVQLCLSTWQQVGLESWLDPRNLEFSTLDVVVVVFHLWREETPWHIGDSTFTFHFCLVSLSLFIFVLCVISNFPSLTICIKIFSPEVAAVLEGERPKNFFRNLLQVSFVICHLN